MPQSSPELWSQDLERLIREALESIRFGTVTLVVQDGRVILGRQKRENPPEQVRAYRRKRFFEAFHIIRKPD